MADQYTWDKAKQAGYTVDVVPITRQTIADGNLLNSSVVEVLSSRDKYINDNLVKETASANSVYSTVNTNSAKNWANSAVSGFSAVKLLTDSNYVIPGSVCTTESPFTWSAGKGIDLQTEAFAAFTALRFDVYSAYKLSYHAYSKDQTNSTTPADIEDASVEEAGFIFGGSAYAAAHSIAAIESTASKNSIAMLNAIASTRSIAMINSIASNYSCFALMQSVANKNPGYGLNIAVNNSYIDSSDGGNDYAICNSSALGGTNNVVAIHSSLVNSRTYSYGGNAFAIHNTKYVGGCAYAALMCQRVYSNAIAYNNCKNVRYGCLAMQTCDDIQASFAANNVSGVAASFAFNACSGLCGTIAFNECGYASTANLMINNCARMGSNNIVINNVSGVNNSAFAVNNCHDMGNKEFAINACNRLSETAFAINNCHDGGAFIINNCHNNSTLTPPLMAVQGCSSCGTNSVDILNVHNVDTNTFNLLDIADAASLVSLNDVHSAGAASLLINHCYPVDARPFGWVPQDSEYSMRNSDTKSVAMNYSVACSNSFALNSGYASAYSIAMLNSTADNWSIAMVNSKASHSAISMAYDTFSANSKGYVNGAKITYSATYYGPMTIAQLDAMTDKREYVFLI